ncbi:hypothetical protein I552_1457 [Mycobacterium xenopi 3993]|nr:hypothetical protein I552_1457 [Mycobacterium xenopi 3993]
MEGAAAALLVGGVTFLVGGVCLLFGLNRIRPTPRRLVQSFGLFNVVFAPIVWATAWYGWLPLSEPGNWALAFAGGVAFALGGWQLNTWRWPSTDTSTDKSRWSPDARDRHDGTTVAVPDLIHGCAVGCGVRAELVAGGVFAGA